MKKLLELGVKYNNKLADHLMDYDTIDKRTYKMFLDIAVPTLTGCTNFVIVQRQKKFSEYITTMEEAFSLVVLENNFARWVWLANKDIENDVHKVKSSVLTVAEVSGGGKNTPNDDTTNTEINQEDDDNDSLVANGHQKLDRKGAEDRAPVPLYQDEMVSLTGRNSAGKWNSQGHQRMNSIIEKVMDIRTKKTRSCFESSILELYSSVGGNISNNKTRRSFGDEEDANDTSSGRRGNKRVKVINLLSSVEFAHTASV